MQHVGKSLLLANVRINIRLRFFGQDQPDQQESVQIYYQQDPVNPVILSKLMFHTSTASGRERPV